jgi:hypothetical protein
MKPIARWTIGESTKDGYECLEMSINSLLNFYDFDIIICHNINIKKLPTFVKKFNLLDQSRYVNLKPKPKGVAWKLYPPRIDLNNHELSIDNDIVFNEKINEINEFLKCNKTLMLEDTCRAYGRFDKHINSKMQINSGIYGMPPKFDFESYVKFYSGNEWQKNAFYQHDKSETFDEQGLVALALSNNSNYIIIPNTTVTNCENNLIKGKGNHFIGLNRRRFHAPFRLYKSLNQKLQM